MTTSSTEIKTPTDSTASSDTKKPDASDKATTNVPDIDSTLRVKLDKLRFDKENPRFVDFNDDNETAIIKFLYDEADLNELIQSISASGFIDYEPIIVLQEGDHYIVLEGNRRLAALRLLRSPVLQKALNVSLPPISKALEAKTNSLRVLPMQSRADARAFIGFKHINGPHKWDSLAKAKYAAEWLTDGGDIQEIARTLGDTHNTVRRLVFGWLVLKQAEDNGFSREQRTSRRFSFSHLYTALSRPGYRIHIGLSEDPSDTPLDKNPVEPGHLPQLNELMVWLYWDVKNHKAALIQSQNPDLTRLNEVLQHNEARKYLISTGSLPEAHEIIAPQSRKFADALIEASRNAKQALSYVTEYDNDPSLLDNAKSLDRAAKALTTLMEDALQESQKLGRTKV